MIAQETEHFRLDGWEHAAMTWTPLGCFGSRIAAINGVSRFVAEHSKYRVVRVIQEVVEEVRGNGG